MLDVISAGEHVKAYTKPVSLYSAATEDKLSVGTSSTKPKLNIVDSRNLFKALENYDSQDQEFKRKIIPNTFYNSSSAFHAFNAIFGDFLPKDLRESLDRASTSFSKLGHSVIQLDLAKEAFKNNRSLDFIAKLTEVLLTFVVNLEDIPLIKGVSGALNMLDYAQAGRVGNQQKNIIENFQANIQEQKRMLHEVVSNGGLKNLFQSPDKEKGHTMALSGYIMLIGSMIGIPYGLNKRNTANKIGSLIKNTGALLSNFAMWNHPNRNLSKAGKFYSADAILDSLQRFIKKETARPINHLVMAINQIASHFYSLSSRDINEAKTYLYA